MIGCTGPTGKMALQMGASHTRWLSLLRQRDARNTRTGVYTPYIKLPLGASGWISVVSPIFIAVID